MSLSKANHIFVLNRRAELAVDYLLFLRAYSSAPPSFVREGLPSCSTVHIHARKSWLGVFSKRFLKLFHAVPSNAVDNNEPSLIKWFSTLYASKKNKITPLVDPEMQTRVLPDGSRVSKYLNSDKLMTHRYDDARTLYEVVRRGARLSSNGPMLGQRVAQEDGSQPYKWISYNELIYRSERMARALRKLDQPIGNTTFIGIYMRNRPEWIFVEQAAYAFSNVIVPLYETLGVEASTYIINQANLEVVFCDELNNVTGLLERKIKECACLKHIILIATDCSEQLQKQAEEVGVSIRAFEELEELGEGTNEGDPLLPPKPEDLCTISYTSGTTGMPKGVMLTHGNVIADCTTIDYLKHSNINHKDVMISFLPLAHMFERIVQAGMYVEGGSVGFFAGDIKYLAEDIRALRPTVMPVVPKVLSRFHDKVMTQVNKSLVSRLIFHTAIAFKSAESKRWIFRNDSFIDRLVFKPIRKGLGGRIKLIATGSAPISNELLNFIRCALGCLVVEGYGQTECVAVCSVTIEGDFIAGHVGVPSPCNAIKLRDVPELNYFAKDQVGEVCIKGHNVFQGYYKMPQETRDTLDEDGWLHTGDVGQWTDRGTLKIIDRKKHIFKLSQGEYVAPEKIENIYLRSKYVAQCFVHGESLKSRLVAIVVPEREVILDLARSTHKDNITLEELCEKPEVKQLILDDIHSIGKDAGLASFEQVNDIYLCYKMFTVGNNLLTPTLKTKRAKLKEHFKEQIEVMYKTIS